MQNRKPQPLGNPEDTITKLHPDFPPETMMQIGVEGSEARRPLSITATVLQSTAKAVFEHLTPGSAGAEMGRVCDRLRTKCGWSNADLKKLRELVRNEMIASDALLAIKEQFGK